MGILDSLIGIHNSLYDGWVTEILTAVIVILLGIIFGRLVGRLTHELLYELEIKKVIGPVITFHRFEKTLSSIVTVAVYLIFIVFALRILGLASYALILVACFILILIGLISLLAVKDFFPNFFSGLYLREQNRFREGDKIKVSNVEGRVERMYMTELLLINSKGDTIYVPYSLLAHEKVKRI